MPELSREAAYNIQINENFGEIKTEDCGALVFLGGRALELLGARIKI